MPHNKAFLHQADLAFRLRRRVCGNHVIPTLYPFLNSKASVGFPMRTQGYWQKLMHPAYVSLTHID